MDIFYTTCKRVGWQWWYRWPLWWEFWGLANFDDTTTGKSFSKLPTSFPSINPSPATSTANCFIEGCKKCHFYSVALDLREFSLVWICSFWTIRLHYNWPENRLAVGNENLDSSHWSFTAFRHLYQLFSSYINCLIVFRILQQQLWIHKSVI